MDRNGVRQADVVALETNELKCRVLELGEKKVMGELCLNFLWNVWCIIYNILDIFL